MKTAVHINLSGDRPNRWGFLTGNIQDQVDLVDLLSSKASHDDVDELNQALDNILVSLENLSDEIDSKASAASVIQALSTKADLVNGVVPAAQLPAFVDDVLNGKLVSDTIFEDENENIYNPESGKIYIDVDTNKSYRWSGIKYVVISDSLALGETASTAGRGDYVKAAHDHALSQGNVHNITTSEIVESNNVRFFREELVRSTILSGIIFTNKTKVTSIDPVETAVGKLQAQLDDLGTQPWININTLSGTSWSGAIPNNAANSKIEFQKRNGNIYMRGYFWTNGNLSNNTMVFLHRDSNLYCDRTFANFSALTVSPYLLQLTATGTNASNTMLFANIAVYQGQAGIVFNNVSGRTLESGVIWHIPEVCIGKAAV